MIVSVLVPCRNEARHIGALLDSLLAQKTGGFEVEFLIADGMSDDGTRDIIGDYVQRHPAIRMIDNPGRIVSTGLNAAIRASRGEIIVRMDAHTEFDPDYIKTCVEVLDRTGANNVGGPARTKAEGTMARAIAAAYHSPFSTGGAKFHNPGYEGYVDTVTYGCWHRNIFDKIGMFDEALVRNQDDEFNLRLTRAGGRIWQSPRIVSWYHPRGTLRHLFQQYFQYGFWKVAVIRKHKLPASWRHLVPGIFMLTLIGLGCATGVLMMADSRLARLTATTLGVMLLCYISAAIVFAFRATQPKELYLLPLLPLVFAVYHFSYGLGFLAGLTRPRVQSTGPKPGGLFAKLSR